MARGRLLKSKVKEAKAISTALMQGIAKADEKKPLEESLKDHLGRIIDRVDPMDILAVGALTVILKPIVQKIPDLANYMTANIPFGVDLAIEAIQKEKIIIYVVKNPLTGEVLWEWSVPNPSGQSAEIPKVVPIPDLNAWVFSFAVAVLLVKFGPALLQSVGGVSGLAGLLVGKVA